MKKAQNICLLIIIGAGICFWNACTTEQLYYSLKVRAVLVDGAPDPDDTLKKEVIKTDTIIQQKTKDIVVQKLSGFVHFPYQEKQCDDCHNKTERSKLRLPQPDLCYSCHDDFNNKFAFIHGPADGGFCTKCHKPHVSQIEKLLTKKGQSLCLDCHQIKDLKSNEVHVDIGESNCTDCHNPHGGNDKYLLN